MNLGNSRFFACKKLTKEQVVEFHEKGYLFLGCTLAEEGLEKIREQVMAAWRILQEGRHISQFVSTPFRSRSKR